MTSFLLTHAQVLTTLRLLRRMCGRRWQWRCECEEAAAVGRVGRVSSRRHRTADLFSSDLCVCASTWVG